MTTFTTSRVELGRTCILSKQNYRSVETLVYTITAWGDVGWYEFSDEPYVFRAFASVTTTLGSGKASRSSSIATPRSFGDAYDEFEGEAIG